MQYNTIVFGNKTFAFAPQCDPLSGSPITGAKIIDLDAFGQSLLRAMDPRRHGGFGFLLGRDLFSLDACESVSCGFGRKSSNPEDYVLRFHQGTVTAFLKRDLVLKTTQAKVLVCTREAYMDCKGFAGPSDWQPEVDYVIVGLVASSGGGYFRSADRLISNLVETKGSPADANLTLEAFRSTAREVVAFNAHYAVVSD